MPAVRPFSLFMPRPARALDFLAIGDTMLDLFVQIKEAATSCELDHTGCRISFPFGQKVPAESMIKVPGAGNGSNAAISASRLGLSSGIYSVLGDDPEAKSILENWKKEGVSTSYVKKAAGQQTNYSTVLNFQGERTILVCHQPFTYALPSTLPYVQRIYYTSLGKEHLDFEKELLSYLSAHPNTRVTYQPGTYQLRRLARHSAEILQRTQILIMNKEEAALYLEEEKPSSLKVQLKKLQALGPEICVITDAEKGSYALQGKRAWACKALKVECKERTGAGDSYASAFTWAIDKGFSLQDAMRYGTMNASNVIQYLGPHEGLLGREGLNRLLRKHPQIKPTPFAL